MEDTFTFLAVLSRSWAMVAMLLAFLGIVLWAFRPGSRKVHRDTADIPFRHEDAPLPDGDGPTGSQDRTEART